jgi:hypothetical protein
MNLSQFPIEVEISRAHTPHACIIAQLQCSTSIAYQLMNLMILTYIELEHEILNSMCQKCNCRQLFRPNWGW